MKLRGIIFTVLFALPVGSSAMASIEPSPSEVQPFGPMQELDQLIASLDTVERVGSDFYRLGPNVVVENCKSYPHYSIVRAENRDGHKKLIQDLKEALDRGLRCMLDPSNAFASEHQTNAMKLLSYLSDETLQKTFTCEPGVDQAVAYSNWPDFDPNHPAFLFVKDLIPSFPGILLDPNALAGNHKLYVEPKITPLRHDELDPVFYKMADQAVYNRGLPRENSVPYNATPMLLFHEMLHWTGYVHGEHHLIDEVRLLQAACMGENIYTRSISSDAQTKAKAILADQAYWDLPAFARPSFAGEKSYHVDMFAIFEHTYSTGLYYSPETADPLPSGWSMAQIDQLTLYGPAEEVEIASEVMQDLASSPVGIHKEIYGSITSGKHVIFVGPDQENKPGVQSALFPSLTFDMHRMGVLSGGESSEALVRTLSSNAYGYGRYMSHRTQVPHTLPKMAGVEGWTVGYFFSAADSSQQQVHNRYGPELAVRGQLVYQFWKLSYYIQHHTVTAPSRVPTDLWTL